LGLSNRAAWNRAKGKRILLITCSRGVLFTSRSWFAVVLAHVVGITAFFCSINARHWTKRYKLL
jgi:hypothetical protein